jgi:hypothetical protein
MIDRAILALRQIAAWALWAIGHAVSVPMVRRDWAWLHPAYSRLMQASLQIRHGSVTAHLEELE